MSIENDKEIEKKSLALLGMFYKDSRTVFVLVQHKNSSTSILFKIYKKCKSHFFEKN